MFLERKESALRQNPLRQPWYDLSKTRLSRDLVFVGGTHNGRRKDARHHSRGYDECQSNIQYTAAPETQ